MGGPDIQMRLLNSMHGRHTKRIVETHPIVL